MSKITEYCNIIRRGDLLFLLSDNTPFSHAIISASSPSLPLDHVGIIDVDSHGNITVIEANSHKGVVATPIMEFARRAPGNSQDCGMRLRRLPSDADVDLDEALRCARSHIGKKYNRRFIPAADAMYCSELVQKCYLKSDGTPYFNNIPMNFQCDCESAGLFWREYFAELNMDIPQNLPGTSPLSIYEQTITPI